MGTYRVQLPSRGTLEESFAEMPARVKTFVRTGIAVFTKVAPDNLHVLLKAVLGAIQAGEGSLGDLELITGLGVPQEDIPALVGAMSLLASIASNRADTAEQFVKAAIDFKLSMRGTQIWRSCSSKV